MLDTTTPTATTADMERAVRLKEMSHNTRQSTITALRKLREIKAGGADLSVETVRQIVTTADETVRIALGPRACQILSDARRALRVWDEEPIRRLALSLRGNEVTLAHAIEAAEANFPTDRAKRAAAAIHDLARHLNRPVNAIIATETSVAPHLFALSPEDLGVGSPTSLDNKRRLIRAAMRLVDPISVRGRATDAKRLGEAWRGVLDMLVARTPDHAPAVAAIFRRLALQLDAEGKAPADLTAADLETMVHIERQTHAPAHEDKLRAAAKIWNEAIADNALDAVPFDRTRRVMRLPDVPWETVPTAIREPLDALLESITGSSRGGGDWEALIGDSIDDDLGVPDIDDENEDGVLTIDPGTAKNWRNSVKRVWHAAASRSTSGRIPETIAETFTPINARAFVAAVWQIRQASIEAAGKDWERHKKGRYETSLLQTFVSVGRTLEVDETELSKIVAFIHKIDPSVVGKKKMPDGQIRLVYDDRKIGPRHQEMLGPFNENSVMLRWFEAPEKLWKLALRGTSRPNGPTQGDASLARTALLLRILQRVSPLRRGNLARFRIDGPERHIHLPVGNGEGRLFLPANEMKNLRAVEVRIDPETVMMIKTFVEIFRPVSLARAGICKENPHLFPGAGLARPELGAEAHYPEGYGYHLPDKLSATYAKHLRRKCQLNVDMHVGRHLAAKVILDMDPSAMALVQEILGHKRIETTQSYYAAVSKIIAQTRYLQLLDKATRRALGQVDFTIFFEKKLTG